MRSPVLLTFRHRAGVSPYTSSYDFAETCVFGKQSLPPLHCGPKELHAQALHSIGLPFSRSYGVILPSSLARVISSASGYSPCPRVSVYGTVTTDSRLEVFLGSLGSMTSITRRIIRSSPQLNGRLFLSISTPTTRNRDNQRSDHLPSCILHHSNKPMAAQEYEPASHQLNLSASP